MLSEKLQIHNFILNNLKQIVFFMCIKSISILDKNELFYDLNMILIDKISP